jgi:putative endonuclease
MNIMGLFWVYILETINRKNKMTYYVGYTVDLSRRLLQHKSGKGARYTRGKKEIKLAYTESFPTRSDALKRERELKKLKHQQKADLAKNYTSIPS